MGSRVLATTDGSAVSEAVIPHAASLASALEAELTVARVLTPAMDCRDVLASSLEEAVRVCADRWRGDLAARLEVLGVPAEALIEARRHREEIHDCILRVASEQGALVTAMSSRSSNLVRHTLLGSVALSILNKTPIPLLLAGQRIVPPAERRKHYHIVLTSDGSADSLRAVEAVLPMSEHDGVKVTLLRIHTPRVGDRGDEIEVASAAEDLERLRGRFPNPERVRTEVRSIVKLGGVDSAIVDAASQLDASAIAMASHGHSRKYHVFMGSTALGVLGQSTLPVLLVRSAPAS